jgi:hypothetical protein
MQEHKEQHEVHARGEILNALPLPCGAFPVQYISALQVFRLWNFALAKKK